MTKEELFNLNKFKGTNDKTPIDLRYNIITCDQEYFNKFDTLKEAFESMRHGEQILRLAGYCKIDKRKIILATALCANIINKYLKKRQYADILDMIEMCIGFGNGLHDEEKLQCEFKKLHEKYVNISTAMSFICYCSAPKFNPKYHGAVAYTIEFLFKHNNIFDIGYDKINRYLFDDNFICDGVNETERICREVLSDDILKII